MLTLTYLLIALFATVQSVLRIPLTGDRERDVCALVNCAILGCVWPALFLTWTISSVPILLQTYRFIFLKEVSDATREEAVDLLNSIIQTPEEEDNAY